MKRLAVVAMCVLLTGCAEQSLIDDPTSPTSNATSSDADSDSQAFVFDSGVLEIGDFDPYALGDDLFDPCTEITAEEFAAAGFDNVEPMPEEYAGLARGLSACEVQSDESLTAPGFMNNNADQKHVEEMTGLLTYESEILPTLFTYGPRGGQGIDCFAQIDTTRGGFVVISTAVEGFGNQEENCRRAIDSLESIFEANR